MRGRIRVRGVQIAGAGTGAGTAAAAGFCLGGQLQLVLRELRIQLLFDVALKCETMCSNNKKEALRTTLSLCNVLLLRMEQYQYNFVFDHPSLVIGFERPMHRLVCFILPNCST